MMPIDHGFWLGVTFVWGAVWGSFLNVVVYRLPRDLSVVRPGSSCPSCSNLIPWYHNIPILSWFILGGRCAQCKAPFSIRYPLVELSTALLCMWLWFKLSHSQASEAVPTLTDLSIAWFFLFVFVAAITAIALIDFETMLIPDILSLPPIPLGLVCGLFAGHITGVSLEDALIGMLVGGGTLLSITVGYRLVAKREGMGLGDYRLMALVGAFLGWKSLLFILMASATQGLLYAIGALTAGRLTHRDPDDFPLYEDEAATAQTEPADDGAPLAVSEEPAEAANEAISGENAISGPGQEHTDEEAYQDVGPQPSFRHIAIPFGPFIVLSAIEWLIFEPYLLALLERWVYHPVV
jgi:leader peptidase (prepilin peptidase)/N-methyltransferase